MMLENKFTKQLSQSAPDSFEIIESLVGLALANRGSSAFTALLQGTLLSSKDKISSWNVKDYSRGLYGLSMLPE
jgi:hypothetical protein